MFDSHKVHIKVLSQYLEGLTLTHLLYHVSSLAFIPLKVFIHINGQNWYITEILEVHAVGQRGGQGHTFSDA